MITASHELRLYTQNVPIYTVNKAYVMEKPNKFDNFIAR